MSNPTYAYPYPAQGYYQGPPVMAPPQYYAPPQYPRPPPRAKPSFLKRCLDALFCCCILTDPNITVGVGVGVDFNIPQ